MDGDKERPKELYIDEKWDHAIDLALRRGFYGGVVGVAAAMLLFRASPACLSFLLFEAAKVA